MKPFPFITSNRTLDPSNQVLTPASFALASHCRPKYTKELHRNGLFVHMILNFPMHRGFAKLLVRTSPCIAPSLAPYFPLPLPSQPHHNNALHLAHTRTGSGLSELHCSVCFCFQGRLCCRLFGAHAEFLFHNSFQFCHHCTSSVTGYLETVLFTALPFLTATHMLHLCFMI